MDQTFITRIVEAALLAANQPLALAQLHALFPLDEPAPADSVEQALETLKADCANRGVELVELASGFRYQVQADVHPWVARLWTERQTRYTRATLETMALIAYRQPITRGEIEQVRGVAVNSNIIKALEEREWIRVIGHRDIPGRPELLGTTKHFLDYFGLKRLDELPPLSELKDFGELEPQFQFDGKAMPIGDVASDDASSDTGNDMPSPVEDEHNTAHDGRARDANEGIDADTPNHDESQDESNHPALAEDGDSARSNTHE
ncbi:MAG TPA: SMC-Scp complex subunit ScpB [Luteimonas sp.]|nr:SMC-Scp complex subunit ScpB [Luteimonas sp.]